MIKEDKRKSKVRIFVGLAVLMFLLSSISHLDFGMAQEYADEDDISYEILGTMNILPEEMNGGSQMGLGTYSIQDSGSYYRWFEEPEITGGEFEFDRMTLDFSDVNQPIFNETAPIKWNITEPAEFATGEYEVNSNNFTEFNVAANKIAHVTVRSEYNYSYPENYITDYDIIDNPHGGDSGRVESGNLASLQDDDGDDLELETTYDYEERYHIDDSPANDGLDIEKGDRESGTNVDDTYDDNFGTYLQINSESLASNWDNNDDGDEADYHSDSGNFIFYDLDSDGVEGENDGKYNEHSGAGDVDYGKDEAEFDGSVYYNINNVDPPGSWNDYTRMKVEVRAAFKHDINDEWDDRDSEMTLYIRDWDDEEWDKLDDEDGHGSWDYETLNEDIDEDDASDYIYSGTYDQIRLRIRCEGEFEDRETFGNNPDCHLRIDFIEIKFYGRDDLDFDLIPEETFSDAYMVLSFYASKDVKLKTYSPDQTHHDGNGGTFYWHHIPSLEYFRIEEEHEDPFYVRIYECYIYNEQEFRRLEFTFESEFPGQDTIVDENGDQTYEVSMNYKVYEDEIFDLYYGDADDEEWTKLADLDSKTWTTSTFTFEYDYHPDLRIYSKIAGDSYQGDDVFIKLDTLNITAAYQPFSGIDVHNFIYFDHVFQKNTENFTLNYLGSYNTTSKTGVIDWSFNSHEWLYWIQYGDTQFRVPNQNLTCLYSIPFEMDYLNVSFKVMVSSAEWKATTELGLEVNDLDVLPTSPTEGYVDMYDYPDKLKITADVPQARFDVEADVNFHFESNLEIISRRVLRDEFQLVSDHNVTLATLMFDEDLDIEAVWLDNEPYPIVSVNNTVSINKIMEPGDQFRLDVYLSIDIYKELDYFYNTLGTGLYGVNIYGTSNPYFFDDVTVDQDFTIQLPRGMYLDDMDMRFSDMSWIPSYTSNESHNIHDYNYDIPYFGDEMVDWYGFWQETGLNGTYLGGTGGSGYAELWNEYFSALNSYMYHTYGGMDGYSSNFTIDSYLFMENVFPTYLEYSDWLNWVLDWNSVFSNSFLYPDVYGLTGNPNFIDGTRISGNWRDTEYYDGISMNVQPEEEGGLPIYDVTMDFISDVEYDITNNGVQYLYMQMEPYDDSGTVYFEIYKSGSTTYMTTTDELSLYNYSINTQGNTLFSIRAYSLSPFNLSVDLFGNTPDPNPEGTDILIGNIPYLVNEDNYPLLFSIGQGLAELGPLFYRNGTFVRSSTNSGYEKLWEDLFVDSNEYMTFGYYPTNETATTYFRQDVPYKFYWSHSGGQAYDMHWNGTHFLITLSNVYQEVLVYDENYQYVETIDVSSGVTRCGSIADNGTHYLISEEYTGDIRIFDKSWSYIDSVNPSGVGVISSMEWDGMYYYLSSGYYTYFYNSTWDNIIRPDINNDYSKYWGHLNLPSSMHWDSTYQEWFITFAKNPDFWRICDSQFNTIQEFEWTHGNGNYLVGIAKVDNYIHLCNFFEPTRTYVYEDNRRLTGFYMDNSFDIEYNLEQENYWISDYNETISNFYLYKDLEEYTGDEYQLEYTPNHVYNSSIAWDGTYYWLLITNTSTVYGYYDNWTYTGISHDLSSHDDKMTGVTYDRDQDRFVTVGYSGIPRFYRWTSNWTYVGLNNLAGSNDDPVDVVYHDSRYYVCDVDDQDIYYYSSSFSYQGEFYTYDGAYPHSLGSSGGYLYVLHTNGRVRKYDHNTYIERIADFESDLSSITFGEEYWYVYNINGLVKVANGKITGSYTTMLSGDSEMVLPTLIIFNGTKVDDGTFDILDDDATEIEFYNGVCNFSASFTFTPEPLSEIDNTYIYFAQQISSIPYSQYFNLSIYNYDSGKWDTVNSTITNDYVYTSFELNSSYYNKVGGDYEVLLNYYYNFTEPFDFQAEDHIEWENEHTDWINMEIIPGAGGDVEHIWGLFDEDFDIENDLWYFLGDGVDYYYNETTEDEIYFGWSNVSIFYKNMTFIKEVNISSLIPGWELNFSSDNFISFEEMTFNGTHWIVFDNRNETLGAVFNSDFTSFSGFIDINYKWNDTIYNVDIYDSLFNGTHYYQLYRWRNSSASQDKFFNVSVYDSNWNYVKSYNMTEVLWTLYDNFATYYIDDGNKIWTHYIESLGFNGTHWIVDIELDHDVLGTNPFYAVLDNNFNLLYYKDVGTWIASVKDTFWIDNDRIYIKGEFDYYGSRIGNYTILFGQPTTKIFAVDLLNFQYDWIVENINNISMIDSFINFTFLNYYENYTAYDDVYNITLSFTYDIDIINTDYNGYVLFNFNGNVYNLTIGSSTEFLESFMIDTYGFERFNVSFELYNTEFILEDDISFDIKFMAYLDGTTYTQLYQNFTYNPPAINLTEWERFSTNMMLNFDMLYNTPGYYSPVSNLYTYYDISSIEEDVTAILWNNTHWLVTGDDKVVYVFNSTWDYQSISYDVSVETQGSGILDIETNGTHYFLCDSSPEEIDVYNSTWDYQYSVSVPSTVLSGINAITFDGEIWYGLDGNYERVHAFTEDFKYIGIVFDDIRDDVFQNSDTSPVDIQYHNGYIYILEPDDWIQGTDKVYKLDTSFNVIDIFTVNHISDSISFYMLNNYVYFADFHNQTINKYNGDGYTETFTVPIIFEGENSYNFTKQNPFGRLLDGWSIYGDLTTSPSSVCWNGTHWLVLCTEKVYFYDENFEYTGDYYDYTAQMPSGLPWELETNGTHYIILKAGNDAESYIYDSDWNYIKTITMASDWYPIGICWNGTHWLYVDWEYERLYVYDVGFNNIANITSVSPYYTYAMDVDYYNGYYYIMEDISDNYVNVFDSNWNYIEEYQILKALSNGTLDSIVGFDYKDGNWYAVDLEFSTTRNDVFKLDSSGYIYGEIIEKPTNQSLLIIELNIEHEDGWDKVYYTYSESFSGEVSLNITETLINLGKSEFKDMYIEIFISGNPSNITLDNMSLQYYDTIFENVTSLWIESVYENNLLNYTLYWSIIESNWNGSYVEVWRDYGYYINYTSDYSYTGFNWDVTVSGSNDPRGITWNGTHFFILDTSDEEVHVYYENGTYTGEYWSLTQGQDPRGITWNGTYFFVCDIDDDEVYIYDEDGVYVSSFDTNGDGLGNANGMTSNGTHIFITDNSDDDVYVYTTSGTYVDNWDVAGAGVDNPRGIAFCGNDLLVANKGDLMIYNFSIDGVYSGNSWSISPSTDTRDMTSNGTHVFIIGLNEDSVFTYSRYQQVGVWNRTLIANVSLMNNTLQSLSIMDDLPGSEFDNGVYQYEIIFYDTHDNYEVWEISDVIKARQYYAGVYPNISQSNISNGIFTFDLGTIPSLISNITLEFPIYQSNGSLIKNVEILVWNFTTSTWNSKYNTTLLNNYTIIEFELDPLTNVNSSGIVLVYVNCTGWNNTYFIDNSLNITSYSLQSVVYYNGTVTSNIFERYFDDSLFNNIYYDNYSQLFDVNVSFTYRFLDELSIGYDYCNFTLLDNTYLLNTDGNWNSFNQGVKNVNMSTMNDIDINFEMFNGRLIITDYNITIKYIPYLKGTNDVEMYQYLLYNASIYNGVYDWEDLTIGDNLPSGWINPGNGEVVIGDGFGTGLVINITDDIEYDFGNTEEGVIEFWLKPGIETNIDFNSINWTISNGWLSYYNVSGDSWENITYVGYGWSHYKIEFDTDGSIFGQNDAYRLWINNRIIYNNSLNYLFETYTSNQVRQLRVDSIDGNTYIDAIGFDWEAGYNEGDNYIQNNDIVLTDNQQLTGNWFINFSVNFQPSSDEDYDFVLPIDEYNHSLFVYRIGMRTEDEWLYYTYGTNNTYNQDFSMNMTDYIRGYGKERFVDFYIEFYVSGNPSNVTIGNMSLSDYDSTQPNITSFWIDDNVVVALQEIDFYWKANENNPSHIIINQSFTGYDQIPSHQIFNITYTNGGVIETFSFYNGTPGFYEINFTFYDTEGNWEKWNVNYTLMPMVSISAAYENPIFINTNNTFFVNLQSAISMEDIWFYNSTDIVSIYNDTMGTEFLYEYDFHYNISFSTNTTYDVTIGVRTSFGDVFIMNITDLYCIQRTSIIDVVGLNTRYQQDSDYNITVTLRDLYNEPVPGKDMDYHIYKHTPTDTNYTTQNINFNWGTSFGDPVANMTYYDGNYFRVKSENNVGDGYDYIDCEFELEDEVVLNSDYLTMIVLNTNGTDLEEFYVYGGTNIWYSPTMNDGDSLIALLDTNQLANNKYVRILAIDYGGNTFDVNIDVLKVIDREYFDIYGSETTDSSGNIYIDYTLNTTWVEGWYHLNVSYTGDNQYITIWELNSFEVYPIYRAVTSDDLDITVDGNPVIDNVYNYGSVAANSFNFEVSHPGNLTFDLLLTNVSLYLSREYEYDDYIDFTFEFDQYGGYFEYLTVGEMNMTYIPNNITYYYYNGLAKDTYSYDKSQSLLEPYDPVNKTYNNLDTFNIQLRYLENYQKRDQVTVVPRTDTDSVLFEQSFMTDMEYKFWFFRCPVPVNDIPSFEHQRTSTIIDYEDFITGNYKYRFSMANKTEDNDLFDGLLDLDPVWDIDYDIVNSNGTDAEIEITYKAGIVVENVTIVIDLSDDDLYMMEWDNNATQESSDFILELPDIDFLPTEQTITIIGHSDVPIATIDRINNEDSIDLDLEDWEGLDLWFRAYLDYPVYSKSFYVAGITSSWDLDGVRYSDDEYDIEDNGYFVNPGWGTGISSSYLRFETEPIDDVSRKQGDDYVKYVIDCNLDIDNVNIIFYIETEDRYIIQENDDFDVEKYYNAGDKTYYYILNYDLEEGKNTLEIEFEIQTLEDDLPYLLLVVILITALVVIYYRKKIITELKGINKKESWFLKIFFFWKKDMSKVGKKKKSDIEIDEVFKDFYVDVKNVPDRIRDEMKDVSKTIRKQAKRFRRQ